jgi:hypothetical protein
VASISQAVWRRCYKPQDPPRLSRLSLWSPKRWTSVFGQALVRRVGRQEREEVIPIGMASAGPTGGGQIGGVRCWQGATLAHGLQVTGFKTHFGQSGTGQHIHCSESWLAASGSNRWPYAPECSRSPGHPVYGTCAGGGAKRGWDLVRRFTQHLISK